MEYLYFVLPLGFLIFALIDSGRFVEYDREMCRGIKVGSEVLSPDLEFYLRNLSSDVLTNQTTAFIKKRDQIALIQPITGLLHRNLGLWYIGLVDLSAKEIRIDYRAPISGVLGLAIIVCMFVFEAFTGSPNEVLRAIFVLMAMIPILALGHVHSKRVVRRYIEKNATGDE
ncbi:MAG: hypothetical protein ACOYZ8_09180 [Chloroflexota bacterium]